MSFLFLFLDGVGLGSNNVNSNPFAGVHMPNLEAILDGQPLTDMLGPSPLITERATILPIDACLGIEGRPQSASGQSSILTGKNIPLIIGQHYGPKPSSNIKAILEENNLFSELSRSGFSVSFLNAFPEDYFIAIRSGRRIPGAFAMAALASGIPLNTTEDLYKGNAISADFTAQGWREHLKYKNMPIISPKQAGMRLSELSKNFDFTFFEYWLSDYAGHRRNMVSARELLTTFDKVLGGLLNTWDDDQNMILITSDHGNLEDLSVRNHTRNPVPAILIGNEKLRKRFARDLGNLTDIYPAVIDYFKNHG
jgi:hypothetical protein